MADYKTIILSGEEQEVSIKGCNCDIRNDSSGTVLAKTTPYITEDGSGVLSIPSGQAAKLLDIHENLIYIVGTGKVMLCGNDNEESVFKLSPSAGGGSEVTKAYVDNGDSTMLVLAKKHTDDLSFRENLLINPDFQINQRGKSGDVSEIGEYVADCWKLVSGTACINSDGSIYLNGTLSQKLNLSVNTIPLATSSDAGSTSFDADNGIFSVSSTGENITWCKLEYGLSPTPFGVVNPTSELIKCQRYYNYLGTHVHTRASVITTDFIDFVVPIPMMIGVPSIVGNVFVATVKSCVVQEGFTFAVIKTSPNGTLIRASKASHGLSDACFGTTTGAGLEVNV